MSHRDTETQRTTRDASEHHLRLDTELVAGGPPVLVLQAAEVALDLQGVLAQKVVDRGAGFDDVIVGRAGRIESRVAGGGFEAVANEEVPGLRVPAVGAERRSRLRPPATPEVLRKDREAAELQDDVAADDRGREVVHARARAVKVVPLRLHSERDQRAAAGRAFR